MGVFGNPKEASTAALVGVNLLSRWSTPPIESVIFVTFLVIGRSPRARRHDILDLVADDPRALLTQVPGALIVLWTDHLNVRPRARQGAMHGREILGGRDASRYV
ncbi:MAG TPA: hypothetical protein VNF73_02825 [Candidatus Saccharimonadales bacterium]|nr:hypothetical protein [Candidatus Saccharimonadales bacterium]